MARGRGRGRGRARGRENEATNGESASSGVPEIPAVPPSGFVADPAFLAQLIEAARGEPRVPVGDPFARLNKDFKDLGGYAFDGLGGVQKSSEWLEK